MDSNRLLFTDVATSLEIHLVARKAWIKMVDFDDGRSFGYLRQTPASCVTNYERPMAVELPSNMERKHGRFCLRISVSVTRGGHWATVK